MKKVTKIAIGAFALLNVALQNDDVKQFLANAITAAMHAHPKVALLAGSIATILALVHNPKS